MKSQTSLHFVTLRQLLPLILTVPLFLHLNPWERTFSGLISQADLYAGIVMIVAGLFFVIETKFALKVNGRTNFAGILVAGLAVGTLAFGTAIFTDFYNFESTELNTIISILLGIAIAMYVVQAHHVIIKRKQLKVSLNL